MKKHSHQFVEEYDGLVGFGFSREVNEYTLIYYLQKFADDKHMSFISPKMTDADMEELFNFLGTLLKKYLTDEEYHKIFLKED